MTSFYHLNDVLAENDTTVERLRLQYRLLCNALGINQYELVFHAAPFGDSETTSYLLRNLIQTIAKTSTEDRITICVNNASRAKHTNSGNAKGSPCLRATMHINGKEINAVGVDTGVFAWVADLFSSVVIVHDITLNTVTKRDISQGSQFRSLEFFPLVQLLVHTNTFQCLRTEPFAIDHQKPTSAVNHEYTHPVLHHRWAPWADDLRSIQLVGQAKKFRSDRWYPEDMQVTASIRRNKVGYERIKQQLQENQLLILDRDHFGNTKCLSAHHDGVIGLVKALDKSFWDQVQILTHENKKVTETGTLVRSISDKTGAPCIRNGSSRGPEGEVLVELNYSIDATGKIREEIKDLPLGTILTLS